jgi:hypothetical protein
MAIVTAVATGNYNNYAVTFGGVQPQPGDIVRTGTFTINLNISVTGITFEATSTGSYLISQTEINNAGGNLTFTDCDFVINGSSTTAFRFTHTSGKVTFRDALIINAPSNSVICYSITGSGNVECRDVIWSSGTGITSIFFLQGTGTATITRDVRSTSATNALFITTVGIVNNIGPGVLNVNNVYHGIGTTSGTVHGVVHSGSGTTNITNAYGGQTALFSGAADGVPVLVLGSGTVNIVNAIAGNLSSRAAVRNTGGTTQIYIENAIGNDFGPGGNNLQSVAYQSTNADQASRVFIKNLIFGTYGAIPVSGAIFLQNNANTTAQFRLTPNGSTKTLIDSSISNQSPATSDVRFGIVYQFGDRTGTLIVPAANQVAVGVPTDNTIGTAVLLPQNVLTALQPNPAYITERSLDDDKPLTFSWPNNTDVISGQVSIDNGPYVNLAGNITYLRAEGTRYYYALSYASQDRPIEEGTARYKFTNGSYTMYATLRVVQPNIAGFGPYQLSFTALDNGNAVKNVQFSIVGKTAKGFTNENGVARINVDGNETYTVRVTTPTGYQTVNDITINMPNADLSQIINLQKLVVPDLGDELCVLQLFIKSQGTVSILPINGANIIARLSDCFEINNASLHINTIQNATTDSNGYAELVLLRNTEYKLEISSSEIYDTKVISILVPDEPSAILSDVVMSN